MATPLWVTIGCLILFLVIDMSLFRFLSTTRPKHVSNCMFLLTLLHSFLTLCTASWWFFGGSAIILYLSLQREYRALQS
eukprot:g76981.t1